MEPKKSIIPLPSTNYSINNIRSTNIKNTKPIKSNIKPVRLNIKPVKPIQSNKPNIRNKLGLTGSVDTDKFLIDQLDLKSLLQYYQTDTYTKNLVDNNKKLKELIELLKRDSTYSPEAQAFYFKENEFVFDPVTKTNKVTQTGIIDYTLDLLKNRKVDEAMKIVDFYEPVNKSNIGYDSIYNEYFYGRLFYEILESDMWDSPHIFEDYFSITPKNFDWGNLQTIDPNFNFIADVLEIPLANWPYKDSLKLMINLIKIAIAIHKEQLFIGIVGVWNQWVESIEENLKEEGTDNDLKLFNELDLLIKNHAKKEYPNIDYRYIY